MGAPSTTRLRTSHGASAATSPIVAATASRASERRSSVERHAANANNSSVHGNRPSDARRASDAIPIANPDASANGHDRVANARATSAIAAIDSNTASDSFSTNADQKASHGSIACTIAAHHAAAAPNTRNART